MNDETGVTEKDIVRHHVWWRKREGIRDGVKMLCKGLVACQVKILH